MLGKFLKRILEPEPYQPVFSIEQLRAIGQMPVVCVLPFIPIVDSSKSEQIGPGVGMLLASLTRRNLLLTRAVSVLDAGDSGLMAPPDFDFTSEPEQLAELHRSASVVIQGTFGASQDGYALKLQVCRITANGPTQDEVAIGFQPPQVSKLSAAIADKLSQILKIQLAPETKQHWRIAQPQSWQQLTQHAHFAERDYLAKLIDLVASGAAHPDIMANFDTDGLDPVMAQRGAAAALQQDPWNAQLYFNLATSTMHMGPKAVEAQKLLKTAVTIAPGHGKAHMCLPHVIPHTQTNRDQILAHSEAGYRLLRQNPFAISNFCQYLAMLAPEDPRIFALLKQSIELSPYDPSAYSVAVQHLVSIGRGKEGLPFAQELVRLCTPPLDERTLYSFRQSADVAQQLDRGEFDPLVYAQTHVRACNDPRSRVFQ